MPRTTNLKLVDMVARAEMITAVGALLPLAQQFAGYVVKDFHAEAERKTSISHASTAIGFLTQAREKLEAVSGLYPGAGDESGALQGQLTEGVNKLISALTATRRALQDNGLDRSTAKKRVGDRLADFATAAEGLEGILADAKRANREAATQFKLIHEHVDVGERSPIEV